jgi:competence protein ComEA
MIHRVVVFAVLAVLPFVAAAGADTERSQPSGRGQEKAAVTDHQPVNVNTADVKSLMTLDGVGRKVAEKIVEYRQAHGPFKKPDDVRKVDGIGGGLWERNRERIVVK